MSETKPSVIDQLKAISKNFEELINYENDVGGDVLDLNFYINMQTQVNRHIEEILNRSQVSP